MFHHQRTSGNLTQTLIDSVPYIGNVIVEILLFAFTQQLKLNFYWLSPSVSLASAEILVLVPSCEPGFEYAPWLVCLKKVLFDWATRLEEHSERDFR